jgi:hypothetical protein
MDESSGLASHQIHHPGEPDGVFSQMPQFFDQIPHDDNKLRNIKTRVLASCVARCLRIPSACE